MNIPDITKETNLLGKRVLVRVDFNVPVENGRVVDDFRIQKVLPTLLFLKNAGAKTILLSHIGREKTESLLPVSDYLQKSFPHTFVSGFESAEEKSVFENMQNGDVVLLENLRKWDGEKNGDENFAKALASLGDMYVNDAFPVSHRKDASVFVLPKFLPGFAGPLFLDEVKNLSLALEKHSPFLFLLGGAKFETKIPLITKYLDTADSVFVGGALANDFFMVKGYEMGQSLVEKDVLETLKPLLENPKLLLPVDVVAENPSGKTVKKPNELLPTEKIMDAGPETIQMLQNEISKASFVLWNGPVGNYEGGYDTATLAIAEAIEKSIASGVVGGGDTVAAIEKSKILNPKIFISTAGGAMLDFLANGTLPGIEALEKKG